jgi:exopolysaccharide biosynthesis polyprenyl glycosylphosphotransferase
VLPQQQRRSRELERLARAVGGDPSAQPAASLLPAAPGLPGGVDIEVGEPTAPAPERSFSTGLRRWGLHLELMLTLLVGGTAVAVASRPEVALAALLCWVVGAFYRGRAVTTPLQHQLRVVGSSALLPLALLAVAVGVLGIQEEAVLHALVAVAGAAGVSAVCRSLRWTLQAPVRVLVLGDRAAVATAATQLPRTSKCRVVGAIVVEEGLEDESVPNAILGIPVSCRLEDVSELVELHRADLVLVDPGRGVNAVEFRSLTWALEQQRVAIGVSGVIRSVAPHRLAAGKLGRASVLDVRAPLQSKYVRWSKASVEWVLAAVALVILSPLLVGLMAGVRLTSPGPALFTQVRVGQHGRLFKVYKLRTMVDDAEARKSELIPDNDEDQVLFKVRRDPRVTPLGAFLRRTSLDELPQLLNVLRGDMSLVGPRPHLPEEVELMTSETRRRHAVKPGISGLWQVSGRSDLSSDEASDLDTYYADNWTLSGDVSILARTVKAVLGGKGAY